MVVLEIRFMNHDCETYVLDTDAMKEDIAEFVKDNETIIAQRLYYSPGDEYFIPNYKAGEENVIVNLKQIKTITILLEQE